MLADHIWREKHKAFNHRGQGFYRKKSNVLIKMSQSCKGATQNKEQGIYSAERPGPEQMIWATSRKISAGSGCADKPEMQCKDKNPLRVPTEANTEPPPQAGAWWENSWWDWGWEKHKNPREGRGRKGSSQEDSEIGHHQSQEHWFIKLCWWCKDSLTAMAKGGSWLFPHMDHVQTKIPWVCFQSALKGFRCCNFSHCRSCGRPLTQKCSYKIHL